MILRFQEKMLTLSEDGYLRMKASTFENIPLVHLLSDLDEEKIDSNQLQTNTCGISGYTEWVSPTTPVVTIGWDWRLEIAEGTAHYVLEGFPRSNLMFLDAERRDLGPLRTAAKLKAAVEAIEWQTETANAISARYANTS